MRLPPSAMLKVSLVRSLGTDTGHFSALLGLGIFRSTGLSVCCTQMNSRSSPTRADKAPSLIILPRHALNKVYSLC